MRITPSLLLIFLSGISSALALTIPHQGRYDGQASVEREAAPLSVQQDFHVAESQSNRGSVEYPQKRAAPPDPAKPANTGPATPPTKPGQPVPASPLANGAVLVDNYRVLYPTKAEDICINLIVCEKQFETPEELEARRAPPDGSRLAKRREDIKAFGGDLPMKSAYYYLPFELYAAPRDNNDKAVFEFITDDVKNHKMHAQNAAPAATLKLVTEHVIELQTMGKFVAWLAGTDPVLKQNIIKQWPAKASLAAAKALIGIPWASNLKQTRKNPLTFNDVVFQAMGSKLNPNANVLFDEEVNGIKKSLWTGEDPVHKIKYSSLVQDVLDGKVNSAKLHSVHRNVLAVFDYLQNQLVASRIESIVKEVTEIMKNFKQLTGQDLKNGNGQIVSMDKKFSEYMRKQFKDTEEWGRKWLGDAITLHTEKQFQAKIRELKTLAIDLSHKETDKVKTRRAAYLQTVKDKREILEKAMEPLKTQLKQLKTDLETEKKKIVAIEADVYREPLTSKKQLIRSAGKWKDLVAGFENTEKEIVKQQEKVNQQQRRIDLLYGGRVGQIWRNLEADLRVFRDRRSKLDTWIKMPALP